MASEINVFGIDKLIGDLKAYSEKVEMGFNNAVKEAALNTETGAKMDCPVDMGILRSSIHTEPFEDETGKGYEVLTRLEYAPYVEFGTGAKVSIPNGYDEYALQFKGQKSVAGMNAQPYLIPNFEMQKEQLIAKIKILINNV
jgi:HK97 gp10 family phage protein